MVHVDGTARPQLLAARDDPWLHDVLHRYREKTGLPLCVNTSFNRHEEPIVENPRQAVAELMRGAVDRLLLGDLWVTRRAGVSRDS